MWAKLKFSLAKNLGEKAATDHGYSGLPISPLKIANNLGIVCQRAELEGCYGCLVKIADNFGILYSNKFNNEGLINFTIAHELGHYYLPDHPLKLFPGGEGKHLSGISFGSKNEMEQEADSFAAGLLMPEGLFGREIQKNGDGGLIAVRRLASACHTSLLATAIRYTEYAEYPLAIVVSSGRNIEYCFMSESLKSLNGLSWIRKKDFVPKNTATYKMNANPNASEINEIQEASGFLDQWFVGGPQIEINEDVIHLGGYNKTLTALFSYENHINSEDE